MKRAWPLLVLLFLLAPQLCAQSSAQAASPGVEPLHGIKLQIAGIPNGGKITDLLYRGAQPKEPGLSELKKLGITVVVDLRGEDHEKVAWERARVESLGIRFVHIPVSGWSPPSDAQLVQFLSLFQNGKAEKIFVHCRFGDDRTGVFVAAYRMALEKWTADQAMKEMYFFGFNGFWHPAMKSFIRDFSSRLNSSPGLAALRSATAQP